MTMKSLLERHGDNLALIIGNGINRYGEDKKATNSWDKLLLNLSNTHLPPDKKFSKIPRGLSLPEFFDILHLYASSEKELQKDFSNFVSEWRFGEHHQYIVEWAKKQKAPILTTNFDSLLADAGDCKLKRTNKKGFTDYYPWDSYYGNELITNPIDSFGIWHINGMQYYVRSIRLGLTHYMGCVQKARIWLHRGRGRKLFDDNLKIWQGNKTWLQIIFGKPLLIFGIGLEESEVFLRWLLIERARFFRKFPYHHQPAWYVEDSKDENQGKKLFLESVGIETIQAYNYEEIYNRSVWD